MRKHIPYFSFYPADFMNGVRGLSAQEVGVYTMLLCRIYEENGPVEYHVRRLATYCGMREATFDKVVGTLIDLGKIHLTDGMLCNRRAEAEIAKRANDLKNSSKAGRASAEKRQQNQAKQATPVQRPFNHTDTDTYTEDSIALSRKKPKAERFEEFWNAYPHRGGQKRGKKPALQSYERAVAKGIPEQLLLDAAKRSAMDKTVIDGFARDPATWLNQEGWADEIQPTTSQANDGDRAARLAKMAKIAGAAA